MDLDERRSAASVLLLARLGAERGHDDLLAGTGLTLDALRALTGEPVGLGDVLEYTPAESVPSPRLTAAGVPYTGDPETDAVLDEHPDILARIRRHEAGETTSRPLREIMAELGL